MQVNPDNSFAECVNLKLFNLVNNKELVGIGVSVISIFCWHGVFCCPGLCYETSRPSGEKFPVHPGLSGLMLQFRQVFIVFLCLVFRASCSVLKFYSVFFSVFFSVFSMWPMHFNSPSTNLNL